MQHSVEEAEITNHHFKQDLSGERKVLNKGVKYRDTEHLATPLRVMPSDYRAARFG